MRRPPAICSDDNPGLTSSVVSADFFLSFQTLNFSKASADWFLCRPSAAMVDLMADELRHELSAILCQAEWSKNSSEVLMVFCSRTSERMKALKATVQLMLRVLCRPWGFIRSSRLRPAVAQPAPNAVWLGDPHGLGSTDYG